MMQTVKQTGFLSPEDAERVAATVAKAEQATSAEIKVVVVRRCWRDIRGKAVRLFRKLKLDQTELRNCVMILVATASREFVIFGDKGIHEKVGQGFWDDVRDKMAMRFAEGHFADGLCAGVEGVGAKLIQFYPTQAGDKNEIPNEIVFEK